MIKITYLNSKEMKYEDENVTLYIFQNGFVDCCGRPAIHKFLYNFNEYINKIEFQSPRDVREEILKRHIDNYGDIIMQTFDFKKIADLKESEIYNCGVFAPNK
jgi:hypothetical protein